MRRPITPLLALMAMRNEGDCGIVALSIFTGRTYEDVFEAATKEAKAPHKEGLWCSQLIRTAARLGFGLRCKRNFDFAKDEGILCLNSFKIKKGTKDFSDGHFVVVRRGLIFDGMDVWEPKQYLKANRKFTPTLIIVPV